MKEMIKHLVSLLFVNAIFIFLIRKSKITKANYNIKLIRQPTTYVVISAAVIGISVAAMSISIVAILKWDKNIIVVIAGVFISIGIGRQLIATSLDAVTTSMNSFLSSWASTLLLLAKKRVAMTPEWRSIESQVELILLSRGLDYDLPKELENVALESRQILIEYLDEHKWELEYQQNITVDDSGCLEFAQYAIKEIREMLLNYDQLEDLQERSGYVHTIVLIAIGTLIWLLS